MALIVSKDLKIAHEDFFGDLEYLLESKYGTIRTNEEGRVYRTFEPLLRCKVRNRVRSMIKNPDIILADEPTGNLDTETSFLINNLFKKINEEKNQSIIIVTHSLELANLTNNKYKIEKGEFRLL